MAMSKIVSLCIVLMLSFVLAGLLGCGGDSEGEPEKSAAGTSISNTIPENGAKDVPTTTSILVMFDKAIATPSAANLIFTPPVTGDVSYDAATQTLMLKPATELSKFTDYSLKIDGIIDMEGKSMSPATINFTTSVPDIKRPEITSTFPEDGHKDIVHNTQVVIKFSEMVNSSKLQDGIFFVPEVDVAPDDWVFNWHTAGDVQVTILPPAGTEPFALNKEYIVVISKNGVVDLSGNQMITDHNLKFRTLKYPVENIANLNIPDGRVMEPTWMYNVGRIGKDWVVMWGGGKPPPGAPSRNSPAGTITASSDGRIQDDIEYLAANPAAAHSESVSKGDGNRLTFTSVNLNDIRHHRIIFRSTSSYLTFELKSASGVLPPKYVHIGSQFVNPEHTPFVMENK